MNYKETKNPTSDELQAELYELQATRHAMTAFMNDPQTRQLTAEEREAQLFSFLNNLQTKQLTTNMPSILPPHEWRGYTLARSIAEVIIDLITMGIILGVLVGGLIIIALATAKLLTNQICRSSSKYTSCESAVTGGAIFSVMLLTCIISWNRKNQIRAAQQALQQGSHRLTHDDPLNTHPRASLSFFARNDPINDDSNAALLRHQI